VSAFVAERFWPDADEMQARAAMELIRNACERLADAGVPVRYLGGTFLIEDETLSCRFDGTAQAVRAVHELAGLTYDRLLPSVEVP